MAFMKYAKANMVKPAFNMEGWRNVRVSSANKRISNNLIDQASDIFQKPFNPSEYLLSHVTIVASVDTYEPNSMKLGSFLDNGGEINRKYSDFRITPETQGWINNNNDSWSRGVIAKSYKTFIGAHNFQEHVQIEELSKGRIIDAVARDIGPSVYVDILVATDKKHRELVAAVQSGKMSTLSMGCSIDFSICTKCGHVMTDETNMCSHIKYEKGNTFYDESGKKQKVAELCGHKTAGETGGVVFIEGSWVATPAFAGAVLRNILTAKEVSPQMVRKAQSIINRPPDHWIDHNSYIKTGNLDKYAFDFDADPPSESDDSEGEVPEEEPKEDVSSLREVEDEAYDAIKKRLKKRLKEDIEKNKQKKELGPEDSTDSPNDTIIRQASEYNRGVKKLIKFAKNDAEFINNVSEYNRSSGIFIKTDVYRAALKIGSSEQYSDLPRFLKACENALGRFPNKSEARNLIRLSKLISLCKKTGE